jgi:hypothetical protein
LIEDLSKSPENPELLSSGMHGTWSEAVAIRSMF